MYNFKLREGSFEALSAASPAPPLTLPLQPVNILRRHLIVAAREFTIEELVERSNRETSQAVPTEVSGVM